MNANAISTPAVVNTQTLWWDSFTNQGTEERTVATVAPSPKSTSRDGKAQQSRVPTDVNSERYRSRLLRDAVLRVTSTVPIHAPVIERKSMVSGSLPLGA